jgi:biotin carboxyl carrier protein
MTKLAITIENRTYEVELDPQQQQAGQVTLKVDGAPVTVRLPSADLPLEQIEWLVVDDRPYEIGFDLDLNWIRSYSGIHQLDVRDLSTKATRPSSGDGRLKAPIPGQITRLLVQPGQTVQAGEPVLILEAMKMENEIRATRTGAVSAIHVVPGQNVIRNEVLAEIT